MDDGKKSDLDSLLERSRQLNRFQDLKRDVILPTLRTLMVDLDRKGHLTRLWEKTPERIRFDVQIQTRVPLDRHNPNAFDSGQCVRGLSGPGANAPVRAGQEPLRG